MSMELRAPTTPNHRTVRGAVGIAVLAGLALAGCGANRAAPEATPVQTTEDVPTTATTEAPPKRVTTTSGRPTTTVYLPPTTVPHPVSREVVAMQKTRLQKEGHFRIVAIEPDDAVGSSGVFYGEYNGDHTKCYYKAPVTEQAGKTHDKIGITFTPVGGKTVTFTEPPMMDLKSICEQQGVPEAVVHASYPGLPLPPR